MDRIIKIVIYVAVLFFLSIWVSSIVKSCNSSNDVSISESVEEDALDEFEEDFFEENIGGDEATYDSDMGGGSDESLGNDAFDTNYDEIDNTLNSKSDSGNNNYSSPQSSSNYSNEGRYMVLAGSYLIKDNAQNMVNKLDRLGYNNSEIVVFNMSQYHSVCASRSSSYNEAIQVSKDLKRRGIDNYVHTKH